MSDTEPCAMPLGVLVGVARCGRNVGHEGPCIDDRVIARRGYCERHDVLGVCPQCKSPDPETLVNLGKTP